MEQARSSNSPSPLRLRSPQSQQRTRKRRSNRTQPNLTQKGTAPQPRDPRRQQQRRRAAHASRPRASRAPRASSTTPTWGNASRELTQPTTAPEPRTTPPGTPGNSSRATSPEGAHNSTRAEHSTNSRGPLARSPRGPDSNNSHTSGKCTANRPPADVRSSGATGPGGNSDTRPPGAAGTPVATKHGDVAPDPTERPAEHSNSDSATSLPLPTAPAAGGDGGPEGAPHHTQTAGPTAQHQGGMQPGRNPKEAWGRYAPAYDPTTDPWHADDDDDDHSPRLPQPGQTTRMGGDPKPLIYTVPAAPNQWGYTLTYHPPLQQQHPGPQQHGVPQQQQQASQGWLPTQTQPPQPTQQEEPQPTCQPPDRPPNCNQWGRTLQPVMERPTATATPAQQPTAQQQPPHGGYEPPPWEVPADYVPPWDRDPHRPQPDPIPTQSSSSGETFTQQQPGGTGDAAQPQQHADPGQSQTMAKPAPTHNAQQPTGATTAAEANQADGGPAAAPIAELEEVDAQEQGGGGRAQRPYHEGRGDQRMRGKRFKAAVQTAFGQRGWTKRGEVTWKEVAHLVGLREEDDESEWERVLQEGAQRGNRRPHNRGGTQRTQPKAAEAGRTDPNPTNFSLLLNLHTLPRGAPLPTQPPPQHRAQAPGQSKPQTAAGGGSGDPRRRRGAATAATAPEAQPEEDEDMLQWDGLFNYMLISPGGADRPATFPPELPSMQTRKCICESCRTELGRGLPCHGNPEGDPNTPPAQGGSTGSRSDADRGACNRPAIWQLAQRSSCSLGEASRGDAPPNGCSTSPRGRPKKIRRQRSSSQARALRWRCRRGNEPGNWGGSSRGWRCNITMIGAI